MTTMHTMTRPREDMNEWDECEAAAAHHPPRMAFALWLQLWHTDSNCEFGDLLKEVRRAGYDGELT